MLFSLNKCMHFLNEWMTKWITNESELHLLVYLLLCYIRSNQCSNSKCQNFRWYEIKIENSFNVTRELYPLFDRQNISEVKLLLRKRTRIRPTSGGSITYVVQGTIYT